MKVISLWMPWANWVALEWKTIETRTHNRFASLVGQRIGIHAAQKWDDSALDLASKYLTEGQRMATDRFLRIGGAIICTALVVSHHKLTDADSRDALIDCFETERYGLVLRDIQRIDAIPCRGKQGIWNFEFPAQLTSNAVAPGVGVSEETDTV